MASQNIARPYGSQSLTPRLRPSAQFEAFAAPLGQTVTSFDRWGELLLLPSLIAARGRARSFSNYRRQDHTIFGNAECHFIDGGDCDARAARSDGQFCVAVFDGLAYQLLDLFSLAFAIPGFFKDIGNPEKEQLERVQARLKPAGYGYFRRSQRDPITPHSELAHPVCPLRSQAALYFTAMALDAVWSHELAHAFMGHLDYAHQHLGIRALNETPQDSGDVRQMPLEAEADRFASATLVQSSFSPIPYLPVSLSKLESKTRLRAAFVVSALITWFWAFQQRIDRKFDGIDPYAHGSHPPPLARLHLGFDGGRDMLANLGWQQKNIQHQVFDALSELEVLADAKDWFAILHPSRAFDKEANQFVREIKSGLGQTFQTESANLEKFRFTVSSG